MSIGKKLKKYFKPSKFRSELKSVKKNMKKYYGPKVGF